MYSKFLVLISFCLKQETRQENPRQLERHAQLALSQRHFIVVGRVIGERRGSDELSTTSPLARRPQFRSHHASTPHVDLSSSPPRRLRHSSQSHRASVHLAGCSIGLGGHDGLEKVRSLGDRQVLEAAEGKAVSRGGRVHPGGVGAV